MEKPIKAKPHFYACCFLQLVTIAHDLGYNLLMHGSMNRDFDLVAVPWVDDPGSHMELLKSFCSFLNIPKDENADDFMFGLLPGGRSSYVINMNRECKMVDDVWVDAQYYLDISITPLIK